LSGILKISTFQSPKTIHGFGTKHFSMEDLRNMFPSYKILSLKQVHSTRILRGGPGEGDGILSRERGVILTLRTADCLPILIRNREETVIAAIHAGWRGLCGGIIKEAISHLKQEGIFPHSLEVALGPSIGGCCYEVGEEVPECFRRNGLEIRMNGRNLDLFTTARMQFHSAGVRDEQVHGIPLCTRCHPWLFFSHRGGHKGRMLSFIGLLKDNSGVKI